VDPAGAPLRDGTASRRSAAATRSRSAWVHHSSSTGPRTANSGAAWLARRALTPWGKMLLLSFRDWLFAEATPAEEELDRLEREAEAEEDRVMKELYGFDNTKK